MKTFFVIVMLVGIAFFLKAKTSKLSFSLKNKALSLPKIVGSSLNLSSKCKIVYCGRINNIRHCFSVSVKGFDTKNFIIYLVNGETFLIEKKKYSFKLSSGNFIFKRIN